MKGYLSRIDDPMTCAPFAGTADAGSGDSVMAVHSPRCHRSVRGMEVFIGSVGRTGRVGADHA